MWLYIPSPESDSALELAGSISPSSSPGNTTDETTALWLSVSGTLTRRPSSWRGWRTRPWSQRLFATVSRTSTSALEAWIASWLDFPANRGVAPEAGAEPPTNAGSGPTSSPLPNAPAPAGCSLKTSPDCSVAVWREGRWTTNQKTIFGDFPLFRGLWPKQGSLRNGCVYARPTWAPAIAGSGGSAWPTATSSVDSGSADYSTDSGRHSGTTLTDATKQWATVTSHHRTHDPRQVDHGQQLANQVDQWQTPQTPNGGGLSRSGDRKTEHWATPRASDHKGSDTYGEMAAKSYLCGQAESIFSPLDQTPPLASHPCRPAMARASHR